MSMRSSIVLVAVLATAACAAGPAEARPTGARGPAQPFSVALRDSARRLDGNRINMFAWNSGQFAWDPRSFGGGLYFPRGTNRSVVFASGLWLGAQVGGNPRVAIAEYASEFGPGPMLGNLPDDPTKPQHRVYKVVRWTGNPADSAHVTRSPAELAADPNLDPLAHHGWGEYVAGAAPYGAPTRLYRLPLTGTPDPSDSLDVLGPDVTGDQMLWCVYNDADADNHTHGAGSTAPLGVEIQRTLFAFNGDENLRNTVFMRFRIINKGVNTLDSAFASLWSDPDVGGFSDDVTGCDTTRGLGFAYNARGGDEVYGDQPPAVGYVLLRGPEGLAPGDTLGLTSFNRYVGGNDPAAFIESYRLMRGRLRDGSAIIDPSGQPTTFFYPGDPVRGTGWLDPNPTNALMLVSAGPFRMAPGDTQEVVAAIVIGQGPEHLASVGAMRCATDRARLLFERGFNTSGLPPATPCSTHVAYTATNCPRTTSFWSAEAAFDGALLTSEQMTGIAICVDSLSTLFDWAPGTDLAALSAVVDPPGALDLRQQAKREYAALMANDCAGRLGYRTTADEPIWLNRLTGLDCAAPPAMTIGDLTEPARLLPEFLDGLYANDVLTNRRALDGVDVGLPAFGGGAGPAADVLGSSLDPIADALAFTSAEMRFHRATTQRAYRYLRLEKQSDGMAPPQGRGYLYGGFVTVPLNCWDTDPSLESKRVFQMDVAFVERVLTDDFGTILPAAAQPATFDSTWAPDASGSGGHEHLFAVLSQYTAIPKSEYEIDGAIADGSMPVMYALASRRRTPSDVIDDGDRFHFTWGFPANPSADAMLVALEGQSLAERSVQDAYRALIDCIQPINAGVGIGVVCSGTAPEAITAVSVDKDTARVVITWVSAETPLTANVERRLEGGAWISVGLVFTGPDGFMVFDDTDVIQGARYDYRLAVDVGGQINYYGQVQVDVPGRSPFVLFGARPNPATENLVLHFSLATRQTARLELLDVAGRRVLARDLNLGAGQQVLDLGAGFRAGIYLVRITQGRNEITGKVAVIR